MIEAAHTKPLKMHLEKPTLHNLFNLGGDLTSFGAAYSYAEPTDPILGLAQHILLQVLPTELQPAAHEITKGLAALVVAVASRWAYAWIDKQVEKLKSRKSRKSRKHAEEKSNPETQEGSPEESTEGAQK